MTEDEARAWISGQFGVSRETKLSHFESLLREESRAQNLISIATFESLWLRHFVDSAQLISHAPTSGMWMDVGTGAGLPGMVIALLQDRPVTLVEPRSRRIDFLRRCVDVLGLRSQVTVEHAKVEGVPCAQPVAVISARAVAPLPVLFSGASHCADASTLWLLPKGRSAQSEVEAAEITWQGVFHVEPSLTQPDSGIVIAKRVSPR